MCEPGWWLEMRFAQHLDLAFPARAEGLKRATKAPAAFSLMLAIISRSTLRALVGRSASPWRDPPPPREDIEIDPRTSRSLGRRRDAHHCLHARRRALLFRERDHGHPVCRGNRAVKLPEGAELIRAGCKLRIIPDTIGAADRVNGDGVASRLTERAPQARTRLRADKDRGRRISRRRRGW